jgi:hypothetical protein
MQHEEDSFREIQRSSTKLPKQKVGQRRPTPPGIVYSTGAGVGVADAGDGVAFSSV